MCNYSLLTPENIEQIYYPKRGDTINLTPNMKGKVLKDVKRGDSTIMLIPYEVEKEEHDQK
jgi:hypothetical protein